MQAGADGIVGDGTLEGNEEALITYTDNLLINQLRNAVRSAGKMSEQRIPWSVREEAMTGLRLVRGALRTSASSTVSGGNVSAAADSIHRSERADCASTRRTASR